MRSIVALCLVTFMLGCSSDDAPADASTTDAVPADTGAATFACAEQTCLVDDQFCRILPTAACSVVDAGSCAPGEEQCQVQGAMGCTPERTRSCQSLQGCSNCTCLFDKSPCGGGDPLNIQCRSQGDGITVECPFP